MRADIAGGPWTVTTWAGNGAFGFGEGPQSSTPLAAPHGITLDGDGVMYVAARDRQRILRIANGQVSLVAGNNVARQVDGVGAVASFGNPHGIVAAQVNGALSLFVAEPYGYYVSESDNAAGRAIRRITVQAGNWQVTTLTAATTETGLSYPGGVATDPSTGTVYIADGGGGCIRKLALGAHQQFPVIAGACGTTGRVDGPALSAARFTQPQGLAVQGATIFVADSADSCIRMIADGEVRTIAGTCGTAGASDDPALFNYPSALAVDGSGVLYVSDSGNHCIRRLISEAGQWKVSTIAGVCGAATGGRADGLGSSAQFSTVCGIAIGKDGAIYVADPENNVIRRLAR